MNIFVLDSNPRKCAEMHCDKHVVKMILESAQMICTTHHLHPNKETSYNIPYKQTHTNHPCNKWLRHSLSNYGWLFKLTEALNDEYKYRYNKDVDHKSWTAIKDLPLPDLPIRSCITPWARAMSDEYKIGERTYNNVIKSYHNYYISGKQHILKYTKREQPAWLSHA